MTSERLQSPSPKIHHEVFFTQENYQKYSCVPSFVEFLEKHLHSTKDGDSENQNNHDNLGQASCGTMGSVGNSVSTERGGSNLAPACLGPEMEFPFVSKISIESQRLLLETFKMMKSGELAKVDLQKMTSIQDIKKEVLLEQEEFQKFVYHHAKNNFHLYNFIHPDIWGNFKAEIEGRLKERIGKYPAEIEGRLKERIGKYPQQYSLHETIGLTVGAVFKSDAVLTFEKTLLQVGNVPQLRLPENPSIRLGPEIIPTTAKETEGNMSTTVKCKVVSEDPVAVSLARKHQVDIVISSSGLNILLDNQPPEYRNHWQLPISARRQEENQDHRVVFIDKPLPPQSVSPRTVNWTVYKRALRRLVCQKTCGENTLPDDIEGSSSSDDKLRNETAPKDLQSSRFELESGNCEKPVVSGVGNRKRRAEDKNELGMWKRSKIDDSNSKDNTPEKDSVLSHSNDGNKFFVYNLWRFGKLKVLIRCSVDAYRTDPEKANSFTFFNVLPKLEYQPTFGHEKLTYSEAARLWLHGYIRPQTKLICGRFNVFNSELLRVDELSVSDVLQQGASFNPARAMKMVFQVFQALKRLPEAEYVLSHKCGEMHGCLYKSMGLSNSGANLKSSFDLHKEKSPVISNYTEAEIPWVAIDCNIFLPWQIRDSRIPCTFPAVPAKDLALMAKKEEEAKPKKKKNKKRKKKKGKAKEFADNNKPNQESSNQQLKSDQDRKSLEQTRPERKTMDKARLFASFYDTQPAEKESEVFAVTRRASGPITYDDIDF